jgi:sugar phosphate isomerase/epimerase
MPLNRRAFLTSLAAPAFAGAQHAAPNSQRKPRLRSALCAYSYREALRTKKMSYEDLVRVAVETGIDGLDLTVYWFPSTSDQFIAPLRRLAHQSAVDIYSIAVRSELTRPRLEDRQAEVAQLCHWVDVAQRLGAGHIRVFGGRVPQGKTEDEAAGWVAECLQQAAEYALPRGVILGLENHGGITERAQRILEIVRKVDSPAVRINLDTGNFNREVIPQIEMLLPHAVNIQVKAEMRNESGQRAAADWDTLFQLFARHGYQGYAALEYEAKPDPVTEVPRLLRRLHELSRKYSA